MSAPMKKHPTKSKILIQTSKKKSRLYLVPQSKVKGMLHLLEDYEYIDDWKESFKDLFKQSSEVATIIRGSRHKEEWTQKELADRLGTTQSNVALMETGRRKIGKSMAMKLAEVFQTDYRLFL